MNFNLVGKLSQPADNEITFIPLHNPSGAQFTTTFISESNYKIKADRDVFNTEYPVRWYLIDSTGNRYVVSPIHEDELNVAAYNTSGNEYPNSLSAALIEAY